MNRYKNLQKNLLSGISMNLSFVNKTMLKKKFFLDELHTAQKSFNSVYRIKWITNASIYDCFVNKQLFITVVCQEDYLKSNVTEVFDETSESSTKLLPNGLTAEEDERERQLFNNILIALYLIVVCGALIWMFVCPRKNLKDNAKNEIVS